MEASNIVEEDEEAFLRGPMKGFSSMKHAHRNQKDISAFIDDDSESAKFDVIQGAAATIAMQAGEPRVDSCLSAEPLKEAATFITPAERGSPKFYPLDQQDWEDRIIWDDSPARSENSAESGEISGPDSDAVVNRETGFESGPQTLQLELSKESDEKEHDSFLRNSAVLVEPIGSRDSSNLIDFRYSERRYHPQLLRLESQLEPDNINHSELRKDNVVEEFWQSDALKRLSKVALRNRNIMEGSWLDNIIWDSHTPIAKPKLILDLQDEQMFFEILDNKDGEHLRLHSGAMIITRSSKSSSGDPFELTGHGGQSGGRFNIANDKFYSNRKISQQLKSHSKKRTAHGIKVLHSIPALKLQTMKLKLSK